VNVEADIPERPGMDLIIKHREERFNKKHERELKKLRAMDFDPIKDEDEM
jgi:hypothetical protein